MISASRSAVSGVSSRRLEHDGVAGGERGAELPRGHVERVVPRRDRTDDAERVAPEERRVLLDVLAGGAAFEEARAAGEEAPVVDREVHLELDDRGRLAAVLHLEPFERRRGRPRSRRRPRAASRCARAGCRVRQLWNASLAAATAASTSAASDAGTDAMTSPVAGFRTSSVAPLCAATQAPPMKFWLAIRLLLDRGAGAAVPRVGHDIAW